MRRRLSALAAAVPLLAGGALVSAPAAHAVPAVADRPAGPAAPAESPVVGEPAGPDKSIAFYVGKNLTADGQTLLGGFGHEPSSHWVEVVPAQTHEEGATITVGATEEASLPAELTEIPQAPETARYITSNYSEFAGFPAPLTNGGLNEHNVAARDVWANSRAELVEMTPEGQTGPSYSDLSRIAMERATSARHAVEILGELIDEYGYTTYGGNTHLFADEDEGWVFVELAGGAGLWAAERLGPDDVRVSYPGYIHDFPVEAVDGEHPDFMGSANLVSFAVEQGWYDPQSEEAFNVQEAYQEDFPTEEFDVGQVADPQDPAPYRNPISLEAELTELAPVSLQDMMRLVRDPRWADDRAGYGHVAELRDDLPHPHLATLWLAPTSAVTAPYVPIAIGTESLPVEYAQHRYLTAGAAASYLSPEYAEQEASEYATQTYKRLLYATCARPDIYLGEVTDAFEGFETQLIADWQELYDEVSEDYSSDAAAQLTQFTNERALDGLALGNYLLDSLLERSKEDGGLHQPDVDVPAGTTASARSLSMELDGVSARDRVNCDLGGGWADGSTLDRQGTYGDPDDVPDYAAESGSAAASGPSAWLIAGIGAACLLVGLVLGWLLRRRPSTGAAA